METVSYLNVGGTDYELADKQARNDIGLKADKVELEKVASGSPAGVYANLSELQSAENVDKTRIYLTTDNGNWNYWNGNSWVSGGLYQAISVKNGSITQEKTDFIELTDNLFNKRTIKEQYTIKITDEYTEIPAENTFISDFIAVEENEVYRGKMYNYAIFDSDKEFITGTNSTGDIYKIITIPQKGSYIKITAAISSVDSIFFAKLSSKQNFAMYKLRNEDILNNIPEKSITNNKLMLVKSPEINLYNNDNNLFQCDLDETGNIIFDANNLITDFISVEPNTEYIATCFKCAFYNATYELINIINFDKSPNNIFITPAETKFIKLIANKNYYNSIFIGKSYLIPERGNDTNNRIKYYFDNEYISFTNTIDTKAIKNRAVTGDKTDFLIPCGNLFNKYDVIEGYIVKVNDDGSSYHTELDGISFTSDFIEIESNTEYIALSYSLIFWDKDKNFLKGVNSINGNVNLALTSPNNAYYATITGAIEAKERLYLCKKTDGATAVNKYKIDKNIIKEDEIKILTMPKYTKEAYNYNKNFFNYCYFMGRWELRNINGENVMYTGYQGSKIYFSVKNTENVTIELLDLSGVCTIAYKIDGKDFVRTTSSIIKISNLDKQFEHFIEIVIAGLQMEKYIWTNNVGFALKIITIDDGGIIKAISKKGRKILFYGDSITAGYCLYGIDSATQNGAEVNYVEQCCTLLRADNIRCAISGIGVFHQPSGNNVPNMLGNTSLTPITTYTKNSPIDLLRANTEEEGIEPDFIVVNLGTNDTAINDETFKEGYISMIKRIEQKYSGTEIFCLRPFNGSKETPILEATKECKNCVYVDTKDWKITYTDGLHPDLNGSKIAGEELADFLLKYFGKSYFLV